MSLGSIFTGFTNMLSQAPISVYFSQGSEVRLLPAASNLSLKTPCASATPAIEVKLTYTEG